MYVAKLKMKKEEKGMKKQGTNALRRAWVLNHCGFWNLNQEWALYIYIYVFNIYLYIYI